MIPLKIRQNKKRKYEEITMEQSQINVDDQFKVNNSSLDFMQSMIEYEQKYKRFKQNCQPGSEGNCSINEQLIQQGSQVKLAEQAKLSSTFPIQQNGFTENQTMSDQNESQQKITSDSLYFCELCQFEHD
ncbi:UNKNOWN [Stylonychia lemnae]|uniref:Uncharacterized protein n=1 Tax=Stylonychia lemnae TaxID=5949 RepID=A0A078AT49_STYLE|nr:UNKNOWN [Stylonychia lemnae]|eukprot:CDW85191.1 UNKNOWN [Stylonychia lemnae]